LMLCPINKSDILLGGWGETIHAFNI
jgi:hypothetical protein